MALILTQDRYIVYAKRTICLKIILEALMELQGDVAHVESHFDPFRDSVSVRAR
jgi:hypothetical protein